MAYRLLTCEPLQTKLSFGATAREFISLSWAATTAFAFKLTGWSESSEIPSKLHTLMVRSLKKWLLYRVINMKVLIIREKKGTRKETKLVSNSGIMLVSRNNRK